MVLGKTLPGCSGYNDYFGEYDCFANHSESCENCLVNYHTTGGLWDPISGKKLKPWQAAFWFSWPDRKGLYIYRRRYK